MTHYSDYEPADWGHEPEPCHWCGSSACRHGARCGYDWRERLGPFDLCPYCDSGVAKREKRIDGVHTCARDHRFRPSEYVDIVRRRA